VISILAMLHEILCRIAIAIAILKM